MINETDKNKIRIEIRDTGIGIKEEYLAKIFQPFERAGVNDPKIEGTGLGLSVVQKLIQLLGGDISVESEFEVGSNFIVEFPVNVL